MISVMMAAALVAQAGSVVPNEAQLSTARRVLNETLLDYPTARFREVRGYPTYLCGFVNSKNRMGAYTGWTRFMVSQLAEPRVIWEGDSSQLVEMMCINPSQPLPSEDFSDRLTAR